MAENFIPITNLNDFTFCPASIYFHNLDYETDRIAMQCSDQINGTASHLSLDNGMYSSSANIITGIPVMSKLYGVYGKDVEEFVDEVCGKPLCLISTVVDSQCV